MKKILALIFYAWTALFLFYFPQRVVALYSSLKSDTGAVSGMEKVHKDFFDFCNSAIPVDESVYLIAPNVEMQFGIYYLFHRGMTKSSDYVVVYNADDNEVSRRINREEYTLFKFYGPGKYILIKLKPGNLQE